MTYSTSSREWLTSLPNYICKVCGHSGPFKDCPDCEELRELDTLLVEIPKRIKGIEVELRALYTEKSNLEIELKSLIAKKSLTKV